MKKQKTGNKTKGIGIQHKLYALLALFTFVIIVVVWLFQVFLLSTFYENSKRRELKLAAQVLSENLTADDLDMTGWEEADRKRKAGDDAAMRAFCETVWRISNEKKLKRLRGSSLLVDSRRHE